MTEALPGPGRHPACSAAWAWAWALRSGGRNAELALWLWEGAGRAPEVHLDAGKSPRPRKRQVRKPRGQRKGRQCTIARIYKWVLRSGPVSGREISPCSPADVPGAAGGIPPSALPWDAGDLCLAEPDMPSLILPVSHSNYQEPWNSGSCPMKLIQELFL